MTDRRDTPFNGHVAHVSLRGQVDAKQFVAGEWMQVRTGQAAIHREPGGSRERELLWGQWFLVLEMRDGHAYGLAHRDGYCGWVAEADLGPAQEATHVVDVRETYAKATPELKVTETTLSFFFGSPVAIERTIDGWAEIGGVGLFVPERHLRPIGDRRDDPVDVAELFLGTPYLWGGNSGRGIDCSGLVQAAMLACGLACPGDSDQQRERLGQEIGDDVPPRRGDLYFWEGHAGMLADSETFLHANAHHMMVAREPLSEVIARILAKEGKPVLSRKRVEFPAAD